MTTSEYYKQVGKTFRQLTITGAFTKYVGGMNRPHFKLDRINNNGHYEIGNVRWATRSENCLNRRNSLKNKL